MSLDLTFIDEQSTNKNKYIVNIDGVNYTAYINSDRTITVQGTKIDAQTMNKIVNAININRTDLEKEISDTKTEINNRITTEILNTKTELNANIETKVSGAKTEMSALMDNKIGQALNPIQHKVIEMTLNNGTVTTDFDITTINTTTAYQYIIKLWLNTSHSESAWLPFSYSSSGKYTGKDYYFGDGMHYIYLRRSINITWSINYVYGRFSGTARFADKINVQNAELKVESLFAGYSEYFKITKNGLYACVTAYNGNYETTMFSIYDLAKEATVQKTNYIIKFLDSGSTKGIVCSTPGRLVDCKLITEY